MTRRSRVVINDRRRIKSSKTEREPREISFPSSNYAWHNYFQLSLISCELKRGRRFSLSMYSIRFLFIKVPETKRRICSVNNDQLAAVCTNDRMGWVWFHQNRIVFIYTNIYTYTVCAIETRSLKIKISRVLINIYTLAGYTFVIDHLFSF